MRIDSCMFCQIAVGAVPSEQVGAADGVIAIKDKFPRAPVHILVLPVEHVDSAHALELNGGHADLLASCFRLAQQVAEDYRTADGYRITTNVGRQGGQAIDHLHFHVIGGRQLGQIDDGG